VIACPLASCYLVLTSTKTPGRRRRRADAVPLRRENPGKSPVRNGEVRECLSRYCHGSTLASVGSHPVTSSVVRRLQPDNDSTHAARASTLSRRGLDRLLDDAAAGRFTVVRVVWRDRLARFGVPCGINGADRDHIAGQNIAKRVLLAKTQVKRPRNKPKRVTTAAHRPVTKTRQKTTATPKRRRHKRTRHTTPPPATKRQTYPARQASVWDRAQPTAPAVSTSAQPIPDTRGTPKAPASTRDR
jgi:hypothetical protein